MPPNVRLKRGRRRPGEDMAGVRAGQLRRIAVATATVVLATTVSCSSAVTESAAPESKGPPPRPELTKVTTSMFVERSAVPNSAAMKFAAPEINDVEGPGDPVDPPECGPMFWGPTATQAGTISWSSTSPDTSTNLKVFSLFLSVPVERPDLTTLLGKCRSVEFQG